MLPGGTPSAGINKLELLVKKGKSASRPMRFAREFYAYLMRNLRMLHEFVRRQTDVLCDPPQQ
jgi:hypothetical protein